MALAFIVYMSIVKASLISTITCINNHVFMVLFPSEMNYFATLVGLFLMEKIN